MTYAHTQRGPTWVILVSIGAVGLAGAWWFRADPTLAVVLGSLGVAMVVFAFCFQSLTVADDGHGLAIRFGPLPLFRTHIAYASITHVEAGQSAVIDGWGIHFVPGRGWTYNLWGRSCVCLTVRGRPMRIGSDDAEGLARFIRSKIAP